MLRIFTGNRQEILLDRLAAELARPASNNPLQPETIVCERGVDLWLWQQLAARHRIAANLACVLPATFLWRALRRLTVAAGDAGGDPFDGAITRWRLMRLLPALLAADAAGDCAPLRHYLDGDEDGRKLAQLAARMASLFDGYLVYRPDLIAAWDAGRAAPADIAAADAVAERWQRLLWQALTAETGTRHRVTLMQDFCADDARGRVVVPADLPRRVSVFGLPALPPAYTDILARLARYIDVDLYVLSPSRQFWGDLLAPAAMARVEAETGYAFDIGNRLLAANGQPVRHFLSSLAGQAAVHEDAFAEPQRATLLGRLQADILDLQESSGLPVDDIDDSVRISSAYGPMREVEILHDALLSMFAADPRLQPHDVLVLAPDMAAYGPLVDAVFDAAEGQRHIPHTVADVPARGASPLLVALETLLRLPDSRLAVSEVLALLETPAIAARWKLSAADLDLVRVALHESNVRWGLDGAGRAREGLPADDAHTWHYAFRRLFMGLATGRDDLLVLGTAPSPVFEGQAADVLGRLQDFVDALASWQRRLSAARAAAGWADTVQQLADDFFLAADDEDERALAAIADALRAFRDEITAAGFVAELTPTVFRDDFLARLDVPATHGGGLLRGAVTFCRLQPMRSLPHKVVCLLGMDGEAFPRRQPRNGMDLVELAPRPGDRARRLDDRHLFLETLLSARERLYISYTGRSARDDSPREPSVLVGELIDAVVAMHGGEPARQDVVARLRVQHPLQPFSRRYFDGSSPALHSYDTEWLLAATGREGAAAARLPFCPQPLADTASDGTTVALEALVRFLAHPAKAFLRERLGIFVGDEDEVFDDDEPFAIGGLESWQVAEDWLAARLDGVADADWRALQRARGVLPAGAFGAAALGGVRVSVDAVAGQLAGRLQGLHDERIDLDLGDGQLRGMVRRVNRDGVLRWSTSRIKGKRLLALWVEHLALCAQGHGVTSTLVGRDEQCTLRALDQATARGLIAGLVRLRRDGLRQPLPLFAETSWAFVAGGNAAEKNARSAWAGYTIGSAFVDGERADEANAILFRHLEDVLVEPFMTLAQQVFGPLLAALVVEEQA